MSVRWISELVVDGERAFRIGRDGDELVAEWLGLCELRSDRRGTRSSFVVRDDADPRLAAKVRAGLAAALLRHARGGASLHASAVAKDGRAIACLGASGAGKSTTAAWLCRRRGFALLADDVVALDDRAGVLVAVPTEAEHWLEEAAVTALAVDPSSASDARGAGEKVPVAAAQVALAELPLVAVVSLALGASSLGPSGEAVTLRRLRGHEAMTALLPCLVRFVIDEPEAHVAELELVDRLASRVPLYELRAPRMFEALPAIGDALESLR